MRPNPSRLLFLLFPFLLGSYYGDSEGLSPYLNWKTLETPGFRITFPEDLRETALQSANHLEEVHSLLSPQFHWVPRSKTLVLITDQVDAANGMAGAALRFGIILKATPPENWFSTYQDDDWLRLLILHEYVHMLNMDPTREWTEIGRWIFGDIIRPNSLWPVWMIEGLAVYMETRWTRAGRGRSPLYEMILRAAVHEDTLDTPEFVTLDKINGRNPTFPGGETPYLFGFYLMNQVVSETRDETVLGRMSWESAGRVPFFINGGLKNLTEKTWYDYWNLFVAETRSRMRAQIDRIRSQPVTTYDSPLVTRALQPIGATIAPNGRWVAYTAETTDRHSSLYLKDLRTDSIRRIGTKILGIRGSFTPDSKFFVFSQVSHRSTYSIWSDLYAFNLDTENVTRLTHSLRAKDPHISPTGDQITFTVSNSGKTSLATARLQVEGTRMKLDDVNVVYSPPSLGKVSTPQFNPDGTRIVFSRKFNGKTGEEISEFDLRTFQVRTLVSDGSFNRFPTHDGRGDLYFVSDATGVDNLYRLEKSKRPERVTNLITGLWLPTFDPSSDKPELYASILESTGWQLARVRIPSKSDYRPASVSVTPLQIPTYTPTETSASAEIHEADYSALPSLLPRQWAPLAYVTSDRGFLGGQVLGFDQLDLHEYFIYGGYDTLSATPDLSVQYLNRSFGPNLSVSSSYITTLATAGSGNQIYYRKNLSISASIFYPFRWDRHVLTPQLGFQWERAYIHERTSGGSSLLQAGTLNPSLDLQSVFSRGEASRLAVTTEDGFRTHLGVRFHPNNGLPLFKVLASHRMYFELGEPHAVLSPSIAASFSSRTSGTLASNVILSGRTGSPFSLLGGVTGQSLDALNLRGYPGVIFAGRGAAIGTLDFSLPIRPIFRGLGTLPAFFEYLSGFAFFESGIAPGMGTWGGLLPSAGAGLKLTATTFVRVPLILMAEYHQGLHAQAGGRADLAFSILLGNLGF